MARLLVLAMLGAGTAHAESLPGPAPTAPLYGTTAVAVYIPTQAAGVLPSIQLGMGREEPKGTLVGFRILLAPAGIDPDHTKDIIGSSFELRGYSNPDANLGFGAGIVGGFVWAANSQDDNQLLPLLELTAGARLQRHLSGGGRLCLEPGLGLLPSLFIDGNILGVTALSAHLGVRLMGPPRPR